MSKQKLKTISSKLKKASKAHAGQAKQIDGVISAMPMKKVLHLKKYLQLVKQLLNVSLKYGLALMLLVGV